ncbi:MAG TPA: hypothetical protein DDW50_09735 [Firmicutes bacterium]|nr:hypothetical protein [Bacillota bacterium]
MQRIHPKQLSSATEYGFLWWPISSDYQAQGWGGRYIIVNPKFNIELWIDMVIVFTAANFNKPLRYLQSFIYPVSILRLA